ncbi:E3 ubiquitin-protein ligase XIAP [Holothuria leucospilota]|uniref:E3 ubiquitin-protein ligase XIAP n=1 Tax=Holothuria leucospilota TaxID=206669 RepID=A0A9Q1GZ16_HOLLE|nr:E3 ubiquitin-protein ligase XIAP [Holothuria leucospilota]
MYTSLISVRSPASSVSSNYHPSCWVFCVKIFILKGAPSTLLIMANVSQIPHYHKVKSLLTKSLAVDSIVKHWGKDQVDACLEGVSRNVLLVPSSKALRKKSQREHQTFHDGVPAIVVGTGAESLILKRDMCDEMERYMSFLHKNWPNDAPVSSSKLAKAGFFYIGVNDTVQCFSCTGRINNWDHGDTAMGEHKRLYPKCKFVRGTDQRNVPYSGLVDESQKGTEGKLRPKSASSSSRSGASGSEDDMVRIFKPLTLQESKPTTETLDCFRREINRLLSFRNWPITSPVDRYDLAAAGFYCVNDTTVQCFACFGRISEWRLGDRPRDEHRRLFPACPFISGHRTDNIPLSASEKDQAIKHFAQTTARESQPHQISSNVSEFQRIGGGNSVHGRTTHPLQLVTSQEPTDLTVRYAKYPDKAYELARLETFYQWPQSHNQIPANLARAGFFATGNDDEVKCFYCGGGLKDWDEGDDPWEEHARWFTRCEWLLQQRGPGFVDIVRRKFNQSYFEPHMGIPADQSTTRQPSPPPEDAPHSKGAAKSASSAAAAEPATKPREEGRRKKGDTKKQQPKKQVEKKRQTKKTKSLEERVEEAFQSDVAQFMIDMGQDERIVRRVIRKRLQSGQRPYESSEDLLTAIFEEEASQNTGSGASAQPGSVEGAAGPAENGPGSGASSGGEDSNEAVSEKGRENGPFVKINFGHFQVTLAQLLTLAVCEQLAVFFDFRPASIDTIRNSPTPALDLLNLMKNRGIISQNDVSRLEHALTSVAANQAAQVVRDYQAQVNKLNYSREDDSVELSSIEPETEDPDFEELLVKLAEYLTKPDVRRLCSVFGFTSSEEDRIIRNSKPEKAFLLHLWKKKIILPDDIVILHDTLIQLNLLQAAGKLQTLHTEMISGVSVEQSGQAPGGMQSEELEKLREKNLCKICLDNDVEILFLPCKHLVTCSDCAERIDNCPICRELIDDRLYVYMP